jgi:hypothetical protein
MIFKHSKPSDTTLRRPNRDVPARGSNVAYYSSKNSRQPGGYNSKNSKQRASSGKPKTRHRPWWKYIPTVIAAGIIIFCLIYETMLSSNPKIVIEGAPNAISKSNLQAGSYQKAAQKLLSSSVGNHNKLTINTSAVAASMQKHFPELASVSIALPVLGQRPVMYLELSKPALVLQSQANGYLLIGTDGRALERLSNPNVGGDSLPIVADQTGISVNPGQIAMSQSDVAFIGLVVSQFETQHISIQAMILPAASRELDVHLTGVPYFVKFNLNDNADAKQQIGTFLATRKYLLAHSITPTQYVDARVSGRVYYK